MKKILLLPSTFTGESKDPKLRIYKISLIARAAHTFGITDIGIYYLEDPKFDSHGLGRYIVKVLKYFNTPPYIRKKIFPIDKSLKYIGSAPPMNPFFHIEKDKYQYVKVIKQFKNKTLVEDYKDNKFKVFGTANSNIAVIDVKNKVIVNKDKIEDLYLGYEAFYYNKGLISLLKKYKKQNYLIIGTSKEGKDIRREYHNIKKELSKYRGIVFTFGTFLKGLEDFLSKDEIVYYFKYFINTIPNQQVITIRTEEAVMYTLQAFRILDII